MPEPITHQQLVDLLERLGFEGARMGDRWRSFRHDESETIIILSDREPSDPAPTAEVISARRHLIERGFVSEDEFELAFRLSRAPMPR